MSFNEKNFLEGFLCIQRLLLDKFPVAKATALRGCSGISTLFNNANSYVLHSNMSGLSRKNIFTTPK
jgi:hypothetical protein